MPKKKIKEIFIGSNNKGKLREIADLLPKNLKIYSNLDFKIKSPRETGKTFASNSKLKANFFSNYGLYNETFRRAQDYELWLRALKKGARFGALNKPLIYYNTNNYSWPIETLLRHSYNRLRIFFKYQDITSINNLIVDILHPYILKILSFFYFA